MSVRLSVPSFDRSSGETGLLLSAVGAADIGRQRQSPGRPAATALQHGARRQQMRAVLLCQPS